MELGPTMFLWKSWFMNWPKRTENMLWGMGSRSVVGPGLLMALEINYRGGRKGGTAAEATSSAA